jgi:hypothetical protein
MALLQKVALVPEGVDISPSELTRVAAALSKQANRDFRPAWDVDATVDAFAKLEDVEIDYWPVIVVKDVQGAAGYHIDKNGQPFALVEFGPQWSLTASHECLEMLADPFGNRLVSADLLDQAVALGVAAQRVRYLVEVCDPSEGGQFAYQVNGVLVSDFYTPNFFDPAQATGVRYSFTGAIDGPRQVLDGGYISWEEPVSGDWFQLRMFKDEFSTGIPHVVNLTKETSVGKLLETESVRAAIDRVTKPPPYREGLKGPSLTAARAGEASTDQARLGRAAAIRRDIAALLKPGKAAGPKKRRG